MSNTKFYESTSSGGQVLQCDQTEPEGQTYTMKLQLAVYTALQTQLENTNSYLTLPTDSMCIHFH